jgi:hypothetical protein
MLHGTGKSNSGQVYLPAICRKEVKLTIFLGTDDVKAYSTNSTVFLNATPSLPLQIY